MSYKNAKIKVPIGFIISFFLSVSILVVYVQVKDFDFLSLDDYMYVRDNPIVAQGLTSENIRWAFTSMYAGNWHPLTWLSHMADVTFFGMDPGMHHATNVIFHCANTLLLFFFLKIVTSETGKSAAVALLFALHPLHVESVAWISERKDVLSTFFWMLTLLSYQWYVKGRTAARYILVATCYVFGLMAKPMLVTLPFVLLLLDIWPFKRDELLQTTDQGGSGKSLMRDIEIRWPGLFALIREKIPFFLLAGASSIVTMVAQKGSGAMSTLDIIPFYVRLENAIVSIFNYLAKMLWPLHLAAFYPYPKGFTISIFVVASVLLITVTLFVASAARKAPFLLVGWLWYLVTLMPVIGFIQVGSQSMADRYTYIPLIGVFIMLAWGLPYLFGQRKSGRVMIAAMFCAVVPLLMWSSWIHAGYWKDNITLFSHAIKVTKDNYVAHNSLGVALCNQGEYEQGEAHFMQALRINPNHVQAYNNMGAVLVKQGRYAESLDHFQHALNLDPNDVNAHFNLGIAFDSLGRIDDALSEFQKVLFLNPHYQGALQRLEAALEKQKIIDSTLEHLQRALKEQPGNYLLLMKLADIYKKKGNTNQAISCYEKVLSIHPGLLQAMNPLVILYAETNRFDKALSVSQQILQLVPNDPKVYYNIACIYSRQGMVDESVKYLGQAMGKGFEDKNLLRTDPDLANIRQTEAFKKYLQ